MRQRGIWITVAALVVCAATAAGVALALESGDSPSVSAGGPDHVVREWPDWTGKVTCGSVAFDPLVAFARRPDAAEGNLPAEVAFREFLEAGGMMHGDPKPLNGWRLLGQSGRYAEFANGSPAGTMATWLVGPSPEGLKPITFAGDCAPHRLRHGQAATTWTLARGQHLGPSTRSVRVDLGAGECASGASQDERLEKPGFRVEDGALLMALWVRPLPPGEYTCIGTIEPPVTIHLPRRLGHLKLLDGGVFPPQSTAEELRRERNL
jgi:hypothetical protein